METDAKAFCLYRNWKIQVDMLSAEQSGVLLKNLFHFVDGEKLIEMDDLTKLLFSIMTDTISRDVTKWENKRQQNITNGRKGGRPKKNTEDSAETEKTGEKPKTKRFVPPTVEELKNYIEEESLNVNPESFYNFYESKNWMVGRNRMSNWKSAVKGWHRRQQERGETYGTNSRTEDFDRSQYQ